VQGQWEPTGISEYKLEDGRPLTVAKNGTMTIADTGVRLERMEHRAETSAHR
jgi:hypothetical protein